MLPRCPDFRSSLYTALLIATPRFAMPLSQLPFRFRVSFADVIDADFRDLMIACLRACQRMPNRCQQKAGERCSRRRAVCWRPRRRCPRRAPRMRRFMPMPLRRAGAKPIKSRRFAVKVRLRRSRVVDVSAARMRRAVYVRLLRCRQRDAFYHVSCLLSISRDARCRQRAFWRQRAAAERSLRLRAALSVKRGV